MTKVIQRSDIDELVSSLKSGNVVAFPTETVYGVAVVYNDQKALDKLMEAKNRDYSKAITLMLSSRKDISKYGYTNESIDKIINSFMPGMITLILKKKPSVDRSMTNGKDTIGIRIPDDAFVLSLIEKSGPLLVTSANLSGQENTTNTQEVLQQLDGRIDLVVDGKTTSSIASSVVDCSKEEIQILRTGKITLEQIKGALK